jgi:hypothetical protein
MNQELDFDSIRALCAAREIDIVMSSPPPGYVLCLRGQFDGAGEFFYILAADVEYAELAGGITVGDLFLGTDIPTIAAIVPKWQSLKGVYSGPALAIRSADCDDWVTAVPHGVYLLVANRIEFRRGADWKGA